MSELHLIRSFIAVVEHGGYTRAAEALYLSPSSVYKRVRHLEHRLGCRLVEQVGKRVHITQEGRVALDYAKRLDVLSREFDDAFSAPHSLHRGALVLGADMFSGERLLPVVCMRFQDRHPGIRIRTNLYSDSQHLDASVRERLVDIAFHSDPAPASGVEKRTVIEDAYVCIAPPAHRFAAVSAIAPADLTGERLVAFMPANLDEMSPRIHNWLSRGGAEPRPAYATNSWAVVVELVRSGRGVALAPSQTVRAGDASVLVRPLVDPPVGRIVGVIRAGPRRSPLVDAFCAFVLSGAWHEADLPSTSHSPHSP